MKTGNTKRVVNKIKVNRRSQQKSVAQAPKTKLKKVGGNCLN